jgi:hypothetical protein
MKPAIRSLFALLAITATSLAGNVSPYTYTYSGDPTGVSTNIIDPPAGSIVIDGSNSHRAVKLSAKGSNATYAPQEIIVGGTFAMSGTTGQTTTVANLPANGGSFAIIGTTIVCTAGTNCTAAPVVVIQSGTATVLSATTSLTGTATNTITTVTPIAGAPIVVTGTAAAPLQVKISTTGTSAGTFTGRAFIRGFWLP